MTERYVVDTIGAIAPCSCHGARPTIRGLLPTIVWPSDVDAKKRELGSVLPPIASALDACQTLSAEEAIAWDEFAGRAQSFLSEETPIFGAANKYDEANALLREARSWQDLAEQKCGSAIGPKVEPPDAPMSAADTAKIVKTVVVAGAVIAGAVVLAPIVTEWAAGRRARRAVRTRA